MTEQLKGQLTIFDVYGHDIWSGKTCRERSVQTKAKTSDASSKKRQGSQTKQPLYLNLWGANGLRQDVSWVQGGVLLGEYTMRSFGECPNEERESRLSQILEDSPHPKYCLSARACQGILNRAERRGKELPPLLKETLERQAQSAFNNEQEKVGGARESLYRENEQEHCQRLTTNTYCLEGNGSRESHKGDGYKESDVMYTLNTVEQHAVCIGNGQVDQLKENEKVGALNCMHDQQAVMTYGVDCYNQTQTEEISKALSSAATDSDHIPCVYGLDRASFNQGKNAQYDFAVDEDLAQTLVSRGPGGGTEQTVGTLCARDYKGVGSQYVNEGKCIIQRFE